MAGRLDAGPATVGEIFDGFKEYVSPLFQRQYVWGKKEIDALWENFESILEETESSRFLGAIVLENKESGKAFKPEENWIVDGQQRLTTVYITLLAIGIECQNVSNSNKNSIEIIAAKQIADDIFKTYIYNNRSSYAGRPKIKPTLMDTAQFNKLFAELQGERRAQLMPDFGSDEGKLLDSFRIIQRKIREKIYINKEFDPEKTKSLISVIVDNLKFVQISLGDSDDPHQVFDSLNSKGARLENKDLIRNTVFSLISNDPSEASKIYQSRWIPFERELGDRLENYLFPFTLIHKPNSTKSNMLNALKVLWKGKNPEGILDDLMTYKKAYNLLSAPNVEDSSQISPNVHELIYRLHRMQVPVVTYPFLLQIIEGYLSGDISEDWTKRNLQQIESFLVRRSIAGFEPTGLHRIFKILFGITKGDPEVFIDEIDRQYTIKFPNDAEFANDISNNPLYGRRLARYILEEYEIDIRGGDTYISPPDFSIDHVMPQKLNEKWISYITAEDHSKIKDTWANLTPLTIPANAQKGQMGWEETKKYYITESYFKSTRRLGEEYDEWTMETILDRGRKLSSWAVKRWPKKA